MTADRTPPTYAALLASYGYAYRADSVTEEPDMYAWHNRDIGSWLYAWRDGRWMDSLGYEGTTLRTLRDALDGAHADL